MMFETRDSQIRLRQRLSDRSLSPEAAAEIRNKYADEMRRRAEKARKYSLESGVPAFARPQKE